MSCGIFLHQASNPCVLDWQVDSYPLYHQENPRPPTFKNLGPERGSDLLEITSKLWQRVGRFWPGILLTFPDNLEAASQWPRRGSLQGNC